MHAFRTAPWDRIGRVTLLSLLLAACGGGGGGGGGGGASSSSAPGTPASPVTSNNFSVTVAPDGQSRVINAPCAITQNLGDARNDGLRVAKVSWLQVVEQDATDADARLTGGKPMRVRVDVLASTSGVSRPATRQLQVFNPATSSCTTITLSAPATVPTSANQENLSTAYVADIDGSLVKSGMSIGVVVDDSSGRSATEADRTFAVFTPRVTTATTQNVRIIPLTFQGQTASVPSSEIVNDLLERMFPITTVNTVVGAPVAIDNLATSVGGLLCAVGSITSSLGINLLPSCSPAVGSVDLFRNVLDRVNDVCLSVNAGNSNARTATKCIGLLPDNIIFRESLDQNGTYVGLAFVGGITLIARDFTSVDVSASGPYNASHWMTDDAVTVAHEFGHLMDLDHANCGGAPGLDPRLYTDGRLGGVAGYDNIRGFYFSGAYRNFANQLLFADVMSYCTKEWTSDRGYLSMLNYLVPAAEVQTASAARVSGGDASPRWVKASRRNNQWQLTPVPFVPSTLNASALSAELQTANGTVTVPLLAPELSLPLPSAVTDRGPYFFNLADHDVSSIRLLRNGSLLQDGLTLAP